MERPGDFDVFVGLAAASKIFGVGKPPRSRAVEDNSDRWQDPQLQAHEEPVRGEDRPKKPGLARQAPDIQHLEVKYLVTYQKGKIEALERLSLQSLETNIVARGEPRMSFVWFPEFS